MKEGNHVSGGGGGDPKNVENINVCIDSQPCVLIHQLWDQLTVLEANGFPKVVMVCVEEWFSMRYIWIFLLHEYLSWPSWRLTPIFKFNVHSNFEDLQSSGIFSFLFPECI